jgi:LacI family transcriptional regulator, galactose operon repressor
VNHRRVTLRDVAAAAGVSAGTASNALNGVALVRPATRERVVETARRLGYVPDRNAARLRQGRSECIAVGYTSGADVMSAATFYGLVVRGITEALEEHGYAMRLVRLDAEAAPTPQLGSRRRLSGQDVDGLLVLNWQESALMQRLRSLGVPLVAVDASSAYPDLPSVDNDDRGGVESAIDYLVDLGHRRIAFLNGPLDSPFEHEALAGFFAACERHGLAVEPWLLRASNYSVAGGHAAMTDVLFRGAPTAVFAVDDNSAVGAIQAIQDASLRVPDDISVVGMDDIPLATAVRPALTTARVDLEAIGRQAVALLLKIIAGAPDEPPHIVLPTRLVIRDSAAPPPAALE